MAVLLAPSPAPSMKHVDDRVVRARRIREPGRSVQRTGTRSTRGAWARFRGVEDEGCGRGRVVVAGRRVRGADDAGVAPFAHRRRRAGGGDDGSLPAPPVTSVRRATSRTMPSQTRADRVGGGRLLGRAAAASVVRLVRWFSPAGPGRPARLARGDGDVGHPPAVTGRRSWSARRGRWLRMSGCPAVAAGSRRVADRPVGEREDGRAGVDRRRDRAGAHVAEYPPCTASVHNRRHGGRDAARPGRRRRTEFSAGGSRKVRVTVYRFALATRSRSRCSGGPRGSGDRHVARAELCVTV